MLLDRHVLLDPFEMYREYREQSPVAWEAAMGSWLLFRHEDVKRAMEDTDAFSSENPMGLPKDSPVDLVSAFTGPLPAMVIAELFGVPRSDFKTFQRLAEDIIHLGTQAEAGRAHHAIQELGACYSALVADKRRSGALGEDLTSCR